MMQVLSQAGSLDPAPSPPTAPCTTDLTDPTPVAPPLAPSPTSLYSLKVSSPPFPYQAHRTHPPFFQPLDGLQNWA